MSTIEKKDYLKMCYKGLEKDFYGFDSIDPRMKRIPLDLRNDMMRNQSLENHKFYPELYPENSQTPTQMNFL